MVPLRQTSHIGRERGKGAGGRRLRKGWGGGERAEGGERGMAGEKEGAGREQGGEREEGD